MQIHYCQPINTSSSDNYVDFVYINGVLHSSTDGSGSLAPLNGVPGGGIGKFFALKPGTMQLTFKRYKSRKLEDGTTVKDTITIYDKPVEVKSGKQNVYVYDLTKDAIVLDNEYPYFETTRRMETLGTDSVASVRLVNFLFERVEYDEEGNPTYIPYEGKLQYQWRQYNTKDTLGYDEEGNPITEYQWKNLGEPVGFGECTKRCLVFVDKINGISASGNNASGYQAIYYRLLDENGEVLQGYWSSSTSKLSNYSDYWTAYIGRSYNHQLFGVRTSNKNNTTETYARVANWTSH